MKNLICGHFNNSPQFDFAITLPLKGFFQKTFSPCTIDHYLIKAVAPFPVPPSANFEPLGDLLDHVYAAFMDDVAKRLSSFLKSQGQDGTVQSSIGDSPFAFGSLYFTTTNPVAGILKARCQELFGDITFSKELADSGASWSNLPIDLIGLSHPQRINRPKGPSGDYVM